MQANTPVAALDAIDPRLLQVGIEVDGRIQSYQDLKIAASGTKYANSLQNECEVKISNLRKETLDYILTETSPFNLNRTPKRLILDAGRVSYGLTRVFVGNIISSNPTQPPDIELTLKCLTLNYQKSQLTSSSQPAKASLKTIAQQTAQNLGLALDFQATDKQIGNYNYTGNSLGEVNKLEQAGDLDAYVDNDILVVKDARVPLVNRLTIVNLDTGMVGIPEITERGIRVKFYFDGQTTLGGALQLTSKIYPAVNGAYIIYKLGFELNNREDPFYWVAEGLRT